LVARGTHPASAFPFRPDLPVSARFPHGEVELQDDIPPDVAESMDMERMDLEDGPRQNPPQAQDYATWLRSPRVRDLAACDPTFSRVSLAARTPEARAALEDRLVRHAAATASGGRCICGCGSVFQRRSRKENPRDRVRGGRIPSARTIAWSSGDDSIDDFVQQYLETALWSSTDDNGDPFDKNHDVADLAPAFVQQATKDADAFRARVKDAGITDDVDTGQGGHDFWLTRNRHGAGFWDGDWQEGQRLTEIAHAFGEIEPELRDVNVNPARASA
jgi:hypothetical protein